MGTLFILGATVHRPALRGKRCPVALAPARPARTMATGDVNARLLLAVSTIAFGYAMRRLGLVDVDVGKSLLKVPSREHSLPTRLSFNRWRYHKRTSITA